MQMNLQLNGKRNYLQYLAEAYSQLSQTFKMELFAKVINCYSLHFARYTLQPKFRQKAQLFKKTFFYRRQGKHNLSLCN